MTNRPVEQSQRSAVLPIEPIYNDLLPLPFVFADDEWAVLQPLFDPPVFGRGRRARNVRLQIEGMVFIALSGRVWRKLPVGYGKWNATYQQCLALKRRCLFISAKAILADKEFNRMGIGPELTRAFGLLDRAASFGRSANRVSSI